MLSWDEAQQVTEPYPTEVALEVPSLNKRRREFKKLTGMLPETFLKAGPQVNDELVAEAEAILSKQGRKAALFSSARTDEGNDNWGTPTWLFDLLDKNFGPFTVDTCADAENSKVAGSYFDEAMDGLKQTWTGTCWCNPPYSGVADWVKKAYESVYVDQTAERAVLLVANRTETEWFHDYAARGLVLFLRSRVKFVEPKDLPPLIDPKTGKAKKRSSPTFGSIVVVFDRRMDNRQLPPGGFLAATADFRSAQKEGK